MIKIATGSKLKPLLTSALLVMSLTNAIAGEVYRWVDDAGQVHYGAVKPHNAPAQQLRIAPTPNKSSNAPTASERMQRQQELLDGYQQERQRKRELDNKKRAEAEARQRQCDDARRHLTYFQRADGAPLGRPSGSGEIEWVDDDERDGILLYWREQAEKYCD